MNRDEASRVCSGIADGQEIVVTMISGNVFRGIFHAGSDPRGYLRFDSFEGKPLRAEWSKVESVSSPVSARAVAGSIMVPPEHPLSPARGDQLHPYTVRNPR